MPLNAQESWRQAVRSLRGGLAAALVFSFALNLLMLAVPLYSMQIYDRVLGSGHVETLLLLSLIAGVSLLALGAFEMVRTSLLARTAARFEQILAEPVVAAAARQPGAGAMGLRELAQLRTALTGPAMTALFDVPWLPMALIVLWAVHPAFGAFAAASAVVLALMAVANDVLDAAGAATRRPQPARGAGADRSDVPQRRAGAGDGHARHDGCPHRQAAQHLLMARNRAPASVVAS